MKINQFLQETKTEMKHVNWPTKKQTTNYTIAVVVISAVVAVLLSAFDIFFSAALSKVLGF